MHDFRAVYSGDANFPGGSSDTTSLTVRAASHLTLTSPALVLLGQPITLHAEVSSEAGSPTGTVTFLDGTTVLATVDLSSQEASYTLTGPSPGRHHFFAVYNGDASFATSASSAVLTEVVRGAQDFSSQVRVVRVRSSQGNPLRQTLTLKNISHKAITGPLYLVLDGLTAGVTLQNGTGSSQSQPHRADPYVRLPMRKLNPGQVVVLHLRFNNPADHPLDFTTVVLAGLGVV
jgi:hypothetical protein